jgi:hypothetical protein
MLRIPYWLVFLGAFALLILAFAPSQATHTPPSTLVHATGKEPAASQKLGVTPLPVAIKLPEPQSTAMPADSHKEASRTRPIATPLANSPGTPEKQPDLTNPVPNLIHREGYEVPTRAERDTLPDCGSGMLNKVFVALTEMSAVTPLGSINPPGHTLPTEHLYFHLVGAREEALTAVLVAPGDIWITHIRANYGSTQDAVDYSIHFAVCQDVFGYFNHVKEISLPLQQIIEAQGCPDGAISGSRDCPMQVLEPIAAGTALGSVGKRQGNFDLGIWDVREERSTATQERYRGAEHSYSVSPGLLR